MYRHLLVPIDGSPLSHATVDQAVAYAHACGARLTFFHARRDYAATGEGALMHVVEPAAFSETAAGNARAMLAKAEAAAMAAGVNCTSVVATSDRPYEAILDAARSQCCDLIFMASHGKRGLKGVLLGSVTENVLRRATLPVLVAAVESNLSASDEQRAVATIKDEHRSLAAVIHGLRHVLSELREPNQVPDFALLGAMLFYMEAFPERLHHPKEDAYLFCRLRERTGECNALLDELQRQHAEGSAQFAGLRVALAAYESGEPYGVENFSAAVDNFASAQWRHMSAEEDVVLPAASRHLTSADWREIAQAFSDNADPRFGAEADESFTHLFTRVLNLAADATPSEIRA